jgi:dTDP-L-rhamnose 4-epimerase
MALKSDPKSAPKKIAIVTGGAGFIGCAIAPKLLENGFSVVAIDSLLKQVHPNRNRPQALPAQVELIVADVALASTWDAVLSKYQPHTIIHLAAETGTGQSLSEATRHAHSNVVGTTAMTDALTQRGIKPKHMLITSSRAVYGEGAWKDSAGDVFYPPLRNFSALTANQWAPCTPSQQGVQALPHRSDTVLPNPTSIYGATKLAQETILRCWCTAMGVPLSVLRLQNVYGPGQSPYNSYTGIITLFHRQAKAGKSIEVYEDGNIGRDFVFIDDVVASIVSSIDAPPKLIRALDIGTGIATTIEMAAKVIASAYQAPAPVVCGKFRDGDVRWAVADIAPWRQEFGARDLVSFDAGSARVGEWLMANGYI